MGPDSGSFGGCHFQGESMNRFVGVLLVVSVVGLSSCSSDKGDGGGGAGATLLAFAGGTGSGRITSSPAGINCGADCTEAYDHGTAGHADRRRPRPARPSPAGRGGCSGTGTCIVTIDRRPTVGDRHLHAQHATP